MACLEFVANTVRDLVKQTVEFLIDPTNFAPDMAWQLISPATLAEFVDTPYGSEGNGGELILKGVGDGKDEIYIGIQIKKRGDQTDVRFNGYAGYDPGLAWFEQPGCIYHSTLPILPFPDDNRLVGLALILRGSCWRYKYRRSMNSLISAL